MRFAQTMKNWNEFGVDVAQIHDCDKNPRLDSLGVLKLNNEDSEPYWALVSVWVAGSDEVSYGEAGSIGEVISMTEIPIVFCPFCGADLGSVLAKKHGPI